MTSARCGDLRVTARDGKIAHGLLRYMYQDQALLRTHHALELSPSSRSNAAIFRISISRQGQFSLQTNYVCCEVHVMSALLRSAALSRPFQPIGRSATYNISP